MRILSFMYAKWSTYSVADPKRTSYLFDKELRRRHNGARNRIAANSGVRHTYLEKTRP